MFGFNKKAKIDQEIEERSKEIMDEVKAPHENNELYRVGYDSTSDMATLTLMNNAMSMTLRMSKNEVNRLKRMLDSVFDEECDHGESC